MRAIRRHATYANIAATLALVLSLVGTAAATGPMITGASIRNNSLTGADIRNGSLTGTDVHAGSLGSKQVGTLGAADIKPGSLTTAQLSPAATAQLPMIAVDHILIGLNNASQTLKSFGGFNLTTPANGCTGNGVTLQVTTTANDAVVDGDPDFDTGDSANISLNAGGETRVFTATSPAGDTYGLIVQGGLVNGKCTVGGIIVQGGRTNASPHIIVQGG